MNNYIIFLKFVLISFCLNATEEYDVDKYNNKFEKIKKTNKNAGSFEPEYIDLFKKLNELRSETKYQDIEWKSLGPFKPAFT
jgi:hypothetical protein